MSTWKQMPEYFPADSETVWVKRTYWYGPTFLAQFDVDTQTFTTEDNYVLPWYMIARWRSQ